MSSRNDYIGGETDFENHRLAYKSNTHRFISTYLSPYLEQLPGNAKVIDIGGAGGYVALEIADKYPHLDVISLDASESRTEAAGCLLKGRRNATAVLGDAYRLPFPPDYAQFIFSRFVLQHLPEREKAIREQRRVCRKGGWVLAQDINGYHQNHIPYDERLNTILCRVFGFLAKQGFDPNVGSKLFEFFFDAGFSDIQCAHEGFDWAWGRISDEKLKVFQDEMHIARPAFISALGNEQAGKEAIAYYTWFLKQKNTASFAELYTVSGKIT